MKSILHDFLTTKKRTELENEGKAIVSKDKYTADDFLTPTQVANKFHISTERATSLMKALRLRRSAFALNGHKSQIVVTRNKGHLYLHPMAIDAFKTYLEKQKD